MDTNELAEMSQVEENEDNELSAVRRWLDTHRASLLDSMGKAKQALAELPEARSGERDQLEHLIRLWQEALDAIPPYADDEQALKSLLKYISFYVHTFELRVEGRHGLKEFSTDEEGLDALAAELLRVLNKSGKLRMCRSISRCAILVTRPALEEEGQ